MFAEIQTLTGDQLPQWVRDDFPACIRINLGGCPADRNRHKADNGLGNATAHAHTGYEKGTICINPAYLATAWSAEQPSSTFIHEYAHTITPDRINGKHCIHGAAWRKNYGKLLEQWDVPAELVNRVKNRQAQTHCYLGDANQFNGRKPITAAVQTVKDWKDRASYALRPLASCANELHLRIIRARLNGQSYTQLADWSGLSQSAIYNMLRKYGLLNGQQPDWTGWTG